MRHDITIKFTAYTYRNPEDIAKSIKHDIETIHKEDSYLGDIHIAHKTYNDIQCEGCDKLVEEDKTGNCVAHIHDNIKDDLIKSMMFDTPSANYTDIWGICSELTSDICNGKKKLCDDCLDNLGEENKRIAIVKSYCKACAGILEDVGYFKWTHHCIECDDDNCKFC